MAVNTLCPNVFDAGLPTLAYESAETPAEVYPRIRAAQPQAAIAIGPFGPEILSHEMVRTVLRDPRFHIPPGIILMAQGITSGPLWDKLVNSLLGLEGEPHRRLRSLVSKAFTPRASARLHDTIVEVINDLIDHVAAQGRCDIVDRHRPALPRADHLRAARRARARTGNSSRCGPTTSSPPSPSIPTASTKRSSCTRGANSTPTSTTWSPAGDTRSTDDLLSDLIRAEDDGDRLNADELRMLAAGLLLAGTDTTRNQLAAIRRRPRRPSRPVGAAGRTPRAGAAARSRRPCATRRSPAARCAPCTEDTEFAGVLFPAGTLVIVNTFAANRDTAVYDDPDRFDISRDAAPGRPDLRRRHPLLPRREPGPPGARRGPEDRDPPDPSPSRSGPAPWKPMLGLSGPTTLPIEFSCA